MATNPIPYDSTNFPVNMLKSERRALGRLAHDEGKSMAQFLRERIEAGIKACPELAAKLEEYRAEAVKVAFVGLCLFATVASLFHGDSLRGKPKSVKQGIRLVKVMKGKTRRGDDGNEIDLA